MDTTEPIPATSKQGIATPWIDSLWFQLLLITVLGLGVFFRLSGLGNKVYSHDEVYTSLRAAGYLPEEVVAGLWDGSDRTVEELRNYLRPAPGKSILDTLSITALDGPHQAPTFFVLMHVWMRLIGSTPADMRGLAALFSLLAIPAMYWLAWELFRSTRIAILAAALFAISPFHILFAQDARPYSLWTLAALVSSAALLRAMRKNNRATWLIYALTLVLGVYSHQLFLLVILVHGCYFAILYFMDQQKGYGGFLSALLLACLAYLPWLYFVVTGWEAITSKMSWVNVHIFWQHYLQDWMLIFSAPLLDMDLSSGNLIPYILRAFILLLIGYALVTLIRRSPRPQWLFIVLLYAITIGAFVLPDLLLGGMRSTNGRYFIPANLATLLVTAYFLAKALDRADAGLKMGAKVMLGLVLLAGVASNVNSLYAGTWWNKELSRMPSGLAHEINQDGTLLVVTGCYSTNLGDVLSLSTQLDADVRFRLYRKSDDLVYPGEYESIYWYPSEHENVQEISEEQGLQGKEIFPGTLWQIYGVKE